MTRYLLVACIHSIDRIGSFGGKSLLPRKIWRERNLWEKEIEREGEIRYGGKFIGERYYGTNMLTRGSFRKARASVFCIDVIISSFSDCDILQSQRKFHVFPSSNLKWKWSNQPAPQMPKKWNSYAMQFRLQMQKPNRSAPYYGSDCNCIPRRRTSTHPHQQHNLRFPIPSNSFVWP